MEHVLGRTLGFTGVSHRVDIAPKHNVGQAAHLPTIGTTLNRGSGWPPHVRDPGASNKFGFEHTYALFPRGSFFEFYVHDPVEPRRSGLYEFCIVGVDTSNSRDQVYHAWEPTGRYDRSFTASEVGQKLAFERHLRGVSQGPKGHVEALAGHSRQGVGLSSVVRWPHAASPQTPVRIGHLPEVDSRGRPVLTANCGFHPRNSTDLVGPMIAHWRASYLEGAGGSLPKQLLVIEGSGRIAKQLQGEFPDATVTAVDDASAQKSGPLKALRHRQAFPVNETMFNASTHQLLFGDDVFDAVMVPFAFNRLCKRDDQKLLRLIEECCRVARFWVLVADDEPKEDSGAFERWRSFMISKWGLEVVYSGQLRGGDVPDHYLSPNGAACSRQYLVLRAFQTTRGSGIGDLVPGDTVEILTASRNWRPAMITSISDSKVKVAYSVPPHTITEKVSLAAGHVRKPMTSMAQAASRGAVPLVASLGDAAKEPVSEERCEPPTKEAQASTLDSAADDLVADVVHVAMVLTSDEDTQDVDARDESGTDLQMDEVAPDEGAKELSAPGKNAAEKPTEHDVANSEAEAGCRPLSDPSIQDEDPKKVSSRRSSKESKADFRGNLSQFISEQPKPEED